MREVTRPDHSQPWDVRWNAEDTAIDRWKAFSGPELDFLLHVLGGYESRHRRERSLCTILRCQILDQLQER